MARARRRPWVPARRAVPHLIASSVGADMVKNSLHELAQRHSGREPRPGLKRPPSAPAWDSRPSSSPSYVGCGARAPSACACMCARARIPGATQLASTCTALCVTRLSGAACGRRGWSVCAPDARLRAAYEEVSDRGCGGFQGKYVAYLVKGAGPLRRVFCARANRPPPRAPALRPGSARSGASGDTRAAERGGARAQEQHVCPQRECVPTSATTGGGHAT